MKVLTTIAVTLMIGTVAIFALQSPSMAGSTCEGCSAHAAPASTDGHAAHASMTEPSPVGQVNERGQASSGTMQAVYSSGNLYSCPTHSQVVTDNAEAKCPLCDANLTKMDDGAVKKLQASQPTGCEMDPIVKAGSDRNQICNICSMQLKQIPKPDKSSEKSQDR